MIYALLKTAACKLSKSLKLSCTDADLQELAIVIVIIWLGTGERTQKAKACSRCLPKA